MKIGVQRRIYNAELRNRRLAMGLSQKQLAERARVSSHYVTCLEVFHKTIATMDPEGAHTRRIAEVLGVEPEVIFPKWIKALSLMKRSEDKQVELTPQMLGSMTPRYQGIEMAVGSSADKEIQQEELRKRIDEAMGELSVRERQVLIRRFGLDGAKPQTLEEIGDQWGVSREMIRAIEERALEKLRHIQPIVSIRREDEEDRVY